MWDAIEDTPEDAENLKLRSALMVALKAHLARSDLSQAQLAELFGVDLSQAQLAELFGVTQPRVSDLLRGRSTCLVWMLSSTWRQPRVCASK